MFNLTSNQVLLNELDKLVKGHTLAKKVLINLVNRSKVRYYQKHGLMEKDTEKLVTNVNCMLIGKSGTGKTFLLESLQKVCKFPLFKVDATTLNPTGASGGMKLGDLVKQIKTYALQVYERDKTYFSPEGVLDQMVVFVDEIDKLGKQDYSEGWNQHVQANFLALFENKIDDLKNVSFVFAGAFMKMDRKVITRNSIGFNAQDDNSGKLASIDERVTQEGILPELMGRIHHIVELDTLTKASYKEILTDILIPKKNDHMLFITGEPLDIPDSEIENIVEQAYNSEQGVRMLSKLLEDYVIDQEFNSYKFDKLF